MTNTHKSLVRSKTIDKNRVRNDVYSYTVRSALIIFIDEYCRRFLPLTVRGVGARSRCVWLEFNYENRYGRVKVRRVSGARLSAVVRKQSVFMAVV